MAGLGFPGAYNGLLNLQMLHLREDTPGFCGVGQKGKEVLRRWKRLVGCSGTLEITRFLSTKCRNGESKEAMICQRPLRVCLVIEAGLASKPPKSWEGRDVLAWGGPSGVVGWVLEL